jgi:hypothetical protein
MTEDLQKVMSQKISDFYILTTKLDNDAEKVRIRLEENKIKNINIIKHPAIGEIISDHAEIQVNGITVAILFVPMECYNYNEVEVDKQQVKIATIDTMMTYYLCFLFIDKKYFLNKTEKIVCMATFLFNVQVENRLAQKGVLKRFTFTCIGTPHTKETIQKEKMEKYKELDKKKNSKEYEEWFLNYRPITATRAPTPGVAKPKPHPNPHYKKRGKHRFSKKRRFIKKHYSRRKTYYN